ncbi:MAG TPA: magnesium transporter [Rhizomicrobium sp.]|nr:magnesium transporter [Rhizomicrobium sp.]
MIQNLLARTGELSDFARRLARMHAPDIVEQLNEKPVEDIVRILGQLSDEQVVGIFDEAGLEHPGALMAGLPTARAAHILIAMSSDRAAEIFRQLSEPVREHLFKRLDADTKASLSQVLRYPMHSAGSIMTTEFVSVPANWSVAQTLDHVRKVERSRETIYAIYVLDPASHDLLQAISLRRLIAADPDVSVLSAAPQTAPLSVSPLTDREDAARMISKYDMLAVPVVEDRKIIGIVTVDDMIDAILEESTEDVQKFGGMAAIDEPYMRIGFTSMIRKRAGWLAVLFLSEMLTASAMQHFADELQQAIVLTLFIPLIMSSGGNSGSQATSLLIRALALQQVRLRDWWRVALREIPTGLTLGAILGVIGIVRISIWQKAGIYDYGPHWELVAATVGAALVGIVLFGSLAGSMLPFALKRLGFDPASASAPFVATLVDVTGLVIYFTVALTILRGTLL